jgi:hypothetical protein
MMSSKLNSVERPALLYRHQPPACLKWPELTGAAGLFLLADSVLLSAAVRSIDLASTHGKARPFLVGLTLK